MQWVELPLPFCKYTLAPMASLRLPNQMWFNVLFFTLLFVFPFICLENVHIKHKWMNRTWQRGIEHALSAVHIKNEITRILLLSISMRCNQELSFLRFFNTNRHFCIECSCNTTYASHLSLAVHITCPTPSVADAERPEIRHFSTKRNPAYR